MPFNSFLFLLGFLPLAVGGYALVSRIGAGWAKGWLLVVSLLFYGIAAARFLPLLLLSVGGNFLLLRAMTVPARQGTEGTSARRGVIAAVGCLLNLALLAWFKFFAPSVWDNPVLPLGISFFTFSQIGCLLWYAAADEPPPRPDTYALFVLFFPALTAGPILNAGEMLPQFTRTGGWRLSRDNLAVGSGFFLIGLLKKTLLADPLSGIVAAGFAHPTALSLLPAWQVAASWSLQLYFDFSGYTDMAIGLGWMFGFRFPDNFEQPYRARSVVEYWQRWHMSLTRFLMANVHAPVTMHILRWRRGRGLPINQAAQQTVTGFAGMIAAPILLTMVLAGIWHGSALTFLLFGLLHAGYLLINHAWRLWRAPVPPPILAVALTYLSVLAAGVLFRAGSASDAVAVLAGMAGLHGANLPAATLRGVVDLLWIAALYAVVWGAPTTRRLMHGDTARPGWHPRSWHPRSWHPRSWHPRSWHPRSWRRPAWRPTATWAVAMGCAATLGLLAAGGTGEFVYFQF